MSITDELREWWVRRFPVMDKELHEDFTAIADRIDAEHERELRETGEDIVRDVKREWVRLPLDADGEPIHIGDVVEWSDGSTCEVVGIGDGGTLYYMDEMEGTIGWTNADGKRHHRPDSWERIIEDARTCTGSCGTYTSVPSMRWTNEAAALVARCKALAGDAE